MSKAYCIFHLAPDKQPAWYDDNDMPITFPTEHDAQLQIVDDIEERARQFREGSRPFNDILWDDWVEPVTVHDDGTITDSNGYNYGKRE